MAAIPSQVIIYSRWKDYLIDWIGSEKMPSGSIYNLYVRVCVATYVCVCVCVYVIVTSGFSGA